MPKKRARKKPIVTGAGDAKVEFWAPFLNLPKFTFKESFPQPLPETPELQACLKEIGDIVDKKRKETGRFLKRLTAPFPKLDQSKSATPEEAAIGVLIKHPEWPLAKIAKTIGVHRGTVYRWKRFKEIRDKIEGIARDEARIPKGFRAGNSDNGYRIEAIDDTD